jgi:hypothetical protein
MRGFGVVPCWHISLKIGRFNVAKKSKKAKRGVPARKKKGMNKAKSAKRATVKKRLAWIAKPYSKNINNRV